MLEALNALSAVYAAKVDNAIPKRELIDFLIALSAHHKEDTPIYYLLLAQAHKHKKLTSALIARLVAEANSFDLLTEMSDEFRAPSLRYRFTYAFRYLLILCSLAGLFLAVGSCVVAVALALMAKVLGKGSSFSDMAVILSLVASLTLTAGLLGLMVGINNQESWRYEGEVRKYLDHPNERVRYWAQDALGIERRTTTKQDSGDKR